MKLIRLTFLVSALAMLSGCVAVPVNSGYYDAAPAVYVPAPVIYAPPVFYGPSIGIGIYGGRSGYGGRGGRGGGYRYR